MGCNITEAIAGTNRAVPIWSVENPNPPVRNNNNDVLYFQSDTLFCNRMFSK